MNELLTEDFYEQFLAQFINWSVTTLPRILLILLVFFVVLKVVKSLIRRTTELIVQRTHDSEADSQEREKRAKTLTGIVRGAAVTALWTMFIVTILKELGINIGPILAGAGIIGLAVGFGAQELVRDAISGFFLLLENRIRTGDVALVNGTGGLVESINLRTVTLRDLSGVVHTFQNGKINTLANMTKDWSAMVFDIGVAYKENVDDVIEAIKDEAATLEADEELGPQILQPIEIFGLDKFGDSAVVIKARFKTKPSSQWIVGREFNRRLKAAFDAKGIEIPFPHRTIYWGDSANTIQIRKEE